MERVNVQAKKEVNVSKRGSTFGSKRKNKGLNSGIQFYLKEKIVATLDSDCNLQSATLTGEISLKVTETKFSNIKIFSPNEPTLKFSPNLKISSTSTNTNKLYSPKKEYPLNKRILIAKYTKQLNSLPIKFTIWPNEQDLTEIFLEYEFLNKNKNILIEFEIPHNRNLEYEKGELKNNLLSWKSKETTNSLEFNFKDELKKTFPILCNFSYDGSLIEYDKLVEGHEYEVDSYVEGEVEIVY